MKREVEQYQIKSATLASGTADIEIEINYQFAGDLMGIFAAPANGECTLAVLLTAASGTTAVTVSAKNIYSGDIEEESYWTVETVTATTSGVASVNMLHITNSANYDPNANGIKIKIARSDAVNLTYIGRVLRG